MLVVYGLDTGCDWSGELTRAKEVLVLYRRRDFLDVALRTGLVALEREHHCSKLYYTGVMPDT